VRRNWACFGKYSYSTRRHKLKLHGRSVLVTDGNVERALRKFKKKIAESNLLNDLRDCEFYEKPTTERKRKKSAAKNRWRKKLADQQLPRKLY
jgi:small subunit ribosomal protein S21